MNSTNSKTKEATTSGAGGGRRTTRTRQMRSLQQEQMTQSFAHIEALHDFSRVRSAVDVALLCASLADVVTYNLERHGYNGLADGDENGMYALVCR